MIGCHTSIDIYIKYNVCVVMLQVHYQQYRLLCKQKNISNWQEKNYRNVYIVQLFRHLCFCLFFLLFHQIILQSQSLPYRPDFKFSKKQINKRLDYSFFFFNLPQIDTYCDMLVYGTVIISHINEIPCCSFF